MPTNPGGRKRRTGGGSVVTIAVGIALLALAAPAAASTTLGSPLTQEPNVPQGCEQKPTFTDQSYNGDYFSQPSNQPDCTWFQLGVVGSANYSDPRTGSVPADGRITNVAVRSGPNPSPLRVVIVRQIGDGSTSAGCCAFVSETAPLQPTPTPSGVTNYALDIPVERNVRGNSAVADYVGISGVSGAGTLPLFSTGKNNTLRDNTPGSTEAGFLYPRLGALEGPGGGTRNPGAIPGVEVLLQWTWTPPGAAPTRPGQPAGPGIAALRDRSARVAAGRALINLICNGNVACSGQLELLASGAKGAARKRTSYGRGSYTIRAGAKATVGVKLNGAGRALLGRRKRAAVDLRLTPMGGKAVSARVTLKR